MGSFQGIHCTVNTVSGVESSSVMISWMRPGGDTVTNNSRVAIVQTTTSSTNFVGNLNILYLMEGDEGTYTCNGMILGTSGSASVVLETLSSKSILISFVIS